MGIKDLRLTTYQKILGYLFYTTKGYMILFYLIIAFITLIILSFGISFFIQLKRIRETKRRINKNISNISQRTINKYNSYFFLGKKKFDNSFEKYFIEPTITYQNKSTTIKELIDSGVIGDVKLIHTYEGGSEIASMSDETSWKSNLVLLKALINSIKPPE